MIYRILVSVLLLTGSFALPVIAASSLQGDVQGTDGRPITGAEVRFERKDRISPVITAMTDARGHYSSTGLSAGLYQISVVAGGTVKSSVNVRAAASDTRIDFDLKPTAGKKVKHYVWVASTTGTRIAGHWVEVGDSGAVASMWNSERKSAEYAREMLRRQGTLQRR